MCLGISSLDISFDGVISCYLVIQGEGICPQCYCSYTVILDLVSGRDFHSGLGLRFGLKLNASRVTSISCLRA